jgi:lipoate-protein ligase A
MPSWRLLGLETHNAFMNMAIDEAILTSRVNNLVPNTVRFYRWLPSAVSISKFQDINKEAHVSNCRKFGVDIVRRITGGGTVFHDADGEVTYGVVVDKSDLGTDDIAEVYSRIYFGLFEALRILGVTSDFDEGDARKCPNLTVKGKKISGSAQSHKRSVVLQHGTLLIDADLERMFSFLRPSTGRTCVEIVNSAKVKITSVKRELGRDVSIEDVTAALTRGFAAVFTTDPLVGRLTSSEQALASALYAEKYSSNEWNFHGTTRQ